MLKRDPAPTVYLDLVERLQRAWLTRAEIMAATQLCRNTVKAWLDTMLERGFIVGRPRDGYFQGTRPTEFALVKKWGGVA